MGLQKPKIKPRFTGQKGQGLVEYLMIVAIMAVGSMAVMRILGQSVQARLAKAALVVQGSSDRTPRVEPIRNSHFKKRDMSDFFDGAVSDD